MKTLSRILMVEDEADIQAIARIALETVGGFSVEICSSGAEALERAPALAPDLILMDVMMPRMDGPTTLGRLREMDGVRDVPVIFMTAKVQPQEVAHLRSIGAAGVIGKPFDPMTLAATVRGIFEGKDGSRGAAGPAGGA